VWGLKILVSNESIMILVFLTGVLSLSSQFVDLNVENPLGKGNLVKTEPSM
jgi:hypothetical protein